MLKDKRILVTGAAGFIGTNIAKELLRRGAIVTGTCHKNNPRIEDERFTCIKADLTSREDCHRVTKDMDYVVMTAAYVGGAQKILETPMKFVTDTTVMNVYLLEAAYENHVKKALYVSSGMGYPEKEIPLTEEMAMEGDPYEKYYFGGWSRRYSEIICRMYAEKIQNPMDIAVIRIDNIYGPYDSFTWEKSHVMPALIRKVVERQDPVEVWGDGQDYKDFVYIDDLVEGALLALEKVKGFALYNIASGCNATVNDILKIMLKTENYTDASVVYNSDRPTMIPYKVTSIEKARRELGYQPKVSLEEGIRKTIAWYKEHPVRE